MSAVVLAQHVTKWYGPRRAVTDVSFAIEPGEIVGLLGPNGSGKSTIFRMLTGYLVPTSGRIEVAGHDVVADSLAVRRVISYVPEDAPLYDHMRVGEFLHFMANLKGLRGAAARTAVDAAAERLDLARVMTLLTGKLSRGFRQRVSIAQALLGTPQLLVLDEPTSGLDPHQVIGVRDLIQSLAGSHTVLIASHILPEIAKIASRVIAAVVEVGRMRSFAILLRKEEMALFSSPIAYVVMTVFLLIMGYSFTLTLFISHQPSMVHVFFQMFVLFMLTAPLITMRLVAEERKLRTMEVLLTSPVSEVAIVLAKYFASMSLIVVMLLLSGCYAATLAWFGDPDFGPIYSGYLGLLLFGSALVGTGLLASALTANQVIAALISLSVFLLLWIIDNFGWLLPSPADTLVVNLSLAVHFRPFAVGSIYLSDVGFFLSVTLLTLLLTVRALARR